MDGQKQAVLFIRVRYVGPDEQAAGEAQIAAQRHAGNEAARKLNAHVAREYVEHGGTDRLERRPVMQQMLADLGQVGDADYVITYRADRLARRSVDFAQIEQAVEAAGAAFVFARDAETRTVEPVSRTELAVIRTMAYFAETV